MDTLSRYAKIGEVFVIPRMDDDSPIIESAIHRMRTTLGKAGISFSSRMSTRTITEDDDSEGRLKIECTLKDDELGDRARLVAKVIRELHGVFNDLKKGKAPMLQLFDPNKIPPSDEASAPNRV